MARPVAGERTRGDPFDIGQAGRAILDAVGMRGRMLDLPGFGLYSGLLQEVPFVTCFGTVKDAEVVLSGK